MDRFDVRIIELHGRRHTVVEFNQLRSQDSAVRLCRAVNTVYTPDGKPHGPKPGHWVQLGAKFRKNRGPWRWVGPDTAKKMGVEHFSFMTSENQEGVKAA